MTLKTKSSSPPFTKVRNTPLGYLFPAVQQARGVTCCAKAGGRFSETYVFLITDSLIRHLRMGI